MAHEETESAAETGDGNLKSVHRKRVSVRRPARQERKMDSLARSYCMYRSRLSPNQWTGSRLARKTLQAQIRAVSNKTSTKVSLSNATLVRSQDHDAFLISFFYPPALRDAYMAVQAFGLELRRIPDSVSNQSTGLLRFAWWRQALAECFEVSSD